MTLTSTYDHRIIQGAQSGEFLRRVHQLLLGEDGFYYDIFRSLRIPYEPVVWLTDREVSHEGQIDKAARVIELINAYRTQRPPDGRHRSAGVQDPQPPGPRHHQARADPVGPRPRVPGRRLRRRAS